MRANLEQTLRRIIKPSEDQVLFVDLGPLNTNSVRIEALGLPYTRSTQVTIV